MHQIITIERLPSPFTTYLVGPSASRVLAAVEGVSDVMLRQESADRATLSYEWADPGIYVVGIDQALKTQGMRRIR